MGYCQICGAKLFHHHNYCEKHYPNKIGVISQLKAENKKLRQEIEQLKKRPIKKDKTEYYLNIIKSLKGQIRKSNGDEDVS